MSNIFTRFITQPGDVEDYNRDPNTAENMLRLPFSSNRGRRSMSVCTEVPSLDSSRHEENMLFWTVMHSCVRYIAGHQVGRTQIDDVVGSILADTFDTEETRKCLREASERWMAQLRQPSAAVPACPTELHGLTIAQGIEPSALIEYAARKQRERPLTNMSGLLPPSVAAKLHAVNALLEELPDDLPMPGEFQALPLPPIQVESCFPKAPEPGDTIIIEGKNFPSTCVAGIRLKLDPNNKNHHYQFQSIEHLDDGKLRARIGDLVPPGTYELAVVNHHPWVLSNWIDVEVASPKYAVEFDHITVHDRESVTGKDELMAGFVSGWDRFHWKAKNSAMYQIKEGHSQTAAVSDRWVLPADSDGEVEPVPILEYFFVQVVLVESDVSEAKTISKIVGGLGQIVSEIVKLFKPEIAAVIAGATSGLALLIEAISSSLVRVLGHEELWLSAPELQANTAIVKTIERELKFVGEKLGRSWDHRVFMRVHRA